MLNVFMNTWGNYNENGADGGAWISLPMDEDDLRETLDNLASAMGDEDPEWAIHDYEWTGPELFPVNEMDNVIDINSDLQDLDTLDEYDQKKLALIVSELGYTVQEALHEMDDASFYPGQTIEDVAYELVEDTIFDRDTPEVFRRFFDYSAFAQELLFDGYCETPSGVLYCR